MIVGITGACRKAELAQLKVEDIKDLNSAALIHIRDTKTKQPRQFTITGEFYDIFRKYSSLRPVDIVENRFFLNYRNQKCTKQPVGVNKFGQVPKEIATYLLLDDAKLYTGHCFRRSSATILVDAGGDITTLKRHGGWKSTTVAESYIDESIANKMQVARTILQAVNPIPSTSTAIDTTASDTLSHQEPSVDQWDDCNSNINHSHAAVSMNEISSKSAAAPFVFTNCNNNTITINFINDNANK